MTLIGKFRITDCCGDYIDSIELPVEPPGYDGCDAIDYGYDYAGQVLSAVGIENYRCDGCYDSAYKVVCDDVVDSEGASIFG